VPISCRRQAVAGSRGLTTFVLGAKPYCTALPPNTKAVTLLKWGERLRILGRVKNFCRPVLRAIVTEQYGKVKDVDCAIFVNVGIGVSGVVVRQQNAEVKDVNLAVII
jgi:hypothetical protein